MKHFDIFPCGRQLCKNPGGKNSSDRPRGLFWNYKRSWEVIRKRCASTESSTESCRVEACSYKSIIEYQKHIIAVYSCTINRLLETAPKGSQIHAMLGPVSVAVCLRVSNAVRFWAVKGAFLGQIVQIIHIHPKAKSLSHKLPETSPRFFHRSYFTKVGNSLVKWHTLDWWSVFGFLMQLFFNRVGLIGQPDARSISKADPKGTAIAFTNCTCWYRRGRKAGKLLAT